jgi:hypothetical protein
MILAAAKTTSDASNTGAANNDGAHNTDSHNRAPVPNSRLAASRSRYSRTAIPHCFLHKNQVIPVAMERELTRAARYWFKLARRFGRSDGYLVHRLFIVAAGISYSAWVRD